MCKICFIVNIFLTITTIRDLGTCTEIILKETRDNFHICIVKSHI